MADLSSSFRSLKLFKLVSTYNTIVNKLLKCLSRSVCWSWNEVFRTHFNLFKTSSFRVNKPFLTTRSCSSSLVLCAEMMNWPLTEIQTSSPPPCVIRYICSSMALLWISTNHGTLRRSQSCINIILWPSCSSKEFDTRLVILSNLCKKGIVELGTGSGTTTLSC